jgi:hypothetical protein
VNLRRAGIALLVPAVTAALFLPAAELIVRLAAPRSLPSQEFIRGFVLKDMYLADEDCGFVLAPGFSGRIERDGVVTEFSTNSLGLRGPEPGPKTGARILALGDSFTWGWGVPDDEAWVRAAARALGENAAEGINGGVNGYGTEAELELLRKVGPAVQPDLVLVGFYTNDYMDNFFGAQGFYTVRDGYLFNHFTHEYYRESWLARESHLWRLLSEAREKIRTKWFHGMPSSSPHRGVSQDELRMGMERTVELMATMRDVSDSLGAAFGVVWMAADVYAFPKNPPDIPLRSELRERVASLGIPSLDLLPVFRSERDIPGLFIPGDGHMTVRGNRVAGRAVAAWLRDEELLSRSNHPNP